MKRYLEIEKIVYQELEKNCFGNKKRQGYRHLFGVSTLCIAYSQYVQLDCELCAIMGLLHDYSVYKNNTSFNHAQLSSELARKMLEESLLFENEEIDIIVQSSCGKRSPDGNAGGPGCLSLLPGWRWRSGPERGRPAAIHVFLRFSGRRDGSHIPIVRCSGFRLP